MDIRVKIEGLDTALRRMDEIGKQARYATAVAITRTAKQIEKELQKELGGKLDKPSPFTMRSTFSTSADKVTLTAVVGIKDRKPAGGTAPAVLLKEHFGGGVRGNKPMEKALIAMGAMPSGWRVVPGAAMPLDGYGNPKRAIVREVLGSLKAGVKVAKGRGKRMAMIGYFVIKPGAGSHLVPGIYLQKGQVIRPMLIFIKSAGYQKRIDLPALAMSVVNKDFVRQFDAAFDQAMASIK